MPSVFIRTSLLLVAALVVNAFADLSHEQEKLLKDPGGWDYLKMTDDGLKTDHPCFDGQPHPDECSGRLTLSTDNTFVQEVTIHGDSVPRRGTYTLDNDQLTFFDEFEKQDGPYTIEVNAEEKTLVMYTSSVRIELTLHNKKRKESK